METYLNFIFPEVSFFVPRKQNKTLWQHAPFLEREEKQNDKESMVVIRREEKKGQDPVHKWTE